MPEFITFLKFDEIDNAEIAAAIFRAAGIDVLVEKLSVPNSTDLESASTFHTDISLIIAKEYLNKAREVFIKEHISVKENRNYILPLFTDEELRKVIEMPEQWGGYNYRMAITLLKQREGK